MFLRNLRFDSTYFDGVVDGIFLEDEEMSNLLDEAVSRVKARTENSESRDNVPSAQSVKNLIKDDSELLHG